MWEDPVILKVKEFDKIQNKLVVLHCKKNLKKKTDIQVKTNVNTYLSSANLFFKPSGMSISLTGCNTSSIN